jgi:hypothetical protein
MIFGISSQAHDFTIWANWETSDLGIPWVLFVAKKIASKDASVINKIEFSDNISSIRVDGFST